MYTLIQNCHILDTINETTSKPGYVLINNDTIKAVGEGHSSFYADKIVDCKNGYLLPGLINLHTHINRRHLYRTKDVFRKGAPYVENSNDAKRMLHAVKNAWHELLQGVTTIRDLCSVGRTASELKNCINEGIISGPRLIVCGLAIAATGGHETHRYKGAVQVDGTDEVTKAVRNEIRLNADFIKLMASGGLGGMPEHEHPDWAELTIEEIKAATQVAHSHNKHTTVHAMGKTPVMNSLLGGVDGIEHGAVLSNHALDIMKERNVYYVPTMSGISAVANKEEKQGCLELAKTIRDIVVNPQRKSVEKAFKADILIGAGSDTLGSIQEELKLFCECGMTTMQAIKTATINAARILRLDKQIGSIEVGKKADLLILQNNPVQNLDALYTVKRVFLDGKEINHEMLMNL